MLNNILLVFHVLVSVSIIGLILLQQGKGADAGAAFGGGSSGTVFGSQGSGNFLSRATGILAALFFVTSLALAYLAKSDASTGDAFDEKFKVEQTEPAVDQNEGGDTDTRTALPIESDTAGDVSPSETDTGLPVNE